MMHCHYHPPGTDLEEGAELAMVSFQEQSSGGGWAYYACGPCRKEHGLTAQSEARYTVGPASEAVR